MNRPHWRHGRQRRAALATLVLFLATATANAACPPSASDGTIVRNGDLVLAFRALPGGGRGAKPGPIPMAQHFVIEVQLCERDGISAALLKTADATMPEHKHGMNYRPQIKPLGGGRFRVEGIMFHMAGHWELAFEVQAGKEIKRLTHDIQIE